MKKLLLLIFIVSVVIGQYDYSLEDINPTSENYGVNVGTSFFENKITIHFFGHFTWGTCSSRFEQLNNIYNQLKLEGLPIELIGIGKSTQLNSLENWTDDSDASVCADPSPFPTWTEWGASQRDLYVIDLNGNVIFHESITSGVPDDLEEIILGALNIDHSSLLPKDFIIYQNFPNPFNPETTLIYDLPNDEYVTLTIYDILGNEVKLMVNEYQLAGQKTVNWDATSNNGTSVPSGVYFYSFKAGSFSQTKRMIYLK